MNLEEKIKWMFLKKVLEDMEEEREEGFHVTELVYDCLRRAYYERLYVSAISDLEDIDNSSLSEDTMLTFWIGKKLHEMPISNVEHEGVVMHEYPVRHGKIVGRIDEVIEVDGELIILDKKSCYDKDTEVLTMNGWKKISEVTLNDYVLTMDVKTRKVTYVKPINIIKKRYSGYMVGYVTEAVDMLITPDHWMWIKRRWWQEYRYMCISDWIGRNEWLQIPKWFMWNGKERKIVIEPVEYNAGWRGVDRKEVFEVDPVEWARFLGWFVAEGHINSEGSGVYISQSNKDNIERIREIIEELGWNSSVERDKRGYKIKVKFDEFGIGKQITEHLKRHVYDGNRIRRKTIYCAYNKKVPEYIKHNSIEVIRAFLDEFWLGDGSYSGNSRQRIFVTSSKKLADDLQELIFKAEGVATIRLKDKAGTKCGVIDGREIVSKVDSYQVTEWKRVTDAWFNPAKMHKVWYNGYVYDLMLPKYHTLFVRRNGKAYWSGNCRSIPSKPYDHHVKQVEMYSALLFAQDKIEINKGAILYIDVANKRIKAFTFALNPNKGKILQEMQLKVERLEKALEEKRPPEPKPSWLCGQYCKWFEKCIRDGY